MKKFNLALSLTISLFYIGSCHAQPIGKVRWQEDGRVFSAEGKKTVLDMQNVYDGVEYKGKTYVIGFKIDKDGVNTPYIAEVSADLLGIRYWPFNSIINDIFIYKNSVYINDTAGKVFAFNGGSWQPSDLAFPENAKVVYGDGLSRLVICYNTQPAKAADHNTSGCYSVSPHWKYDFSWFTVEPKVCNNALFTVENKVKGGVFRSLSLATGEVLSVKSLNTLPNNICDIK